jgi:signal transduction histidine kinase
MFETKNELENTTRQNAESLLNAPRFSPGSRFELILLAIEDVIEKRNAEKAAADAERRKNEFIAVMAHELRNPLTTIVMAAHLLQGTLPEEQRDWSLGVILHQVDNLTRLAQVTEFEGFLIDFRPIFVVSPIATDRVSGFGDVV